MPASTVSPTSGTDTGSNTDAGISTTTAGIASPNQAMSSLIRTPKASESFYNTADLLQWTFEYLDRKSLAQFIRVEKRVYSDVARVLYREVPYKLMLNKMSRVNVSTTDEVAIIFCRARLRYLDRSDSTDREWNSWAWLMV